MTPDPATVSLDTDVRDAVAAMLEFDFRHLPVVQAGAVVGMVSLRDLVDTVLGAA
jgi:CBS domain-containing protein